MTKRTTNPGPIVMDDPVPNPYPEFEEEVFEIYLDDGMKPEDLADPKECKAYAAYLARMGKE